MKKLENGLCIIQKSVILKKVNFNFYSFILINVIFIILDPIRPIITQKQQAVNYGISGIKVEITNRRSLTSFKNYTPNDLRRGIFFFINYIKFI